MSQPSLEDLLRQITLGRSFDPETIEIMVEAIEGATAQLPLYSGSRHAAILARSVMDQAALGERNVRVMQAVALLSISDEL